MIAFRMHRMAAEVAQARAAPVSLGRICEAKCPVPPWLSIPTTSTNGRSQRTHTTGSHHLRRCPVLLVTRDRIRRLPDLARPQRRWATDTLDLSLGQSQVRRMTEERLSIETVIASKPLRDNVTPCISSVYSSNAPHDCHTIRRFNAFFST